MQRGPTRRDALRVGAAGLGAALAGCTTTLGLQSKEHNRPEKQQDEFGVLYLWEDGNEPLFELSIKYSGQVVSEHPTPGAYEIPLRFQVWHRPGTHLDSLTYELKKAAGFEHPLLIYWEAPNRNWPDTDFKKSESGKGMTFEVPDLGRMGSGTVVSDFFVRVPTNEETINSLPVRFQAEFELSEGMIGGYDVAVEEDELEIPIQTDR